MSENEKVNVKLSHAGGGPVELFWVKERYTLYKII